jgi:hypothetical protein
MNKALGRLYIIVPSYVLQRKAIRIFSRLGEKRMSHGMESGIAVSFDFLSSVCLSEFQVPRANGAFRSRAGLH